MYYIIARQEWKQVTSHNHFPSLLLHWSMCEMLGGDRICRKEVIGWWIFPPSILGLHHSSQQCQILNPLREARDRTPVIMDPSQVC